MDTLVLHLSCLRSSSCPDFFTTYNFPYFPETLSSFHTMSLMLDPSGPIFNAETAQAFIAMVTDPSYKKKSRVSLEKRNCMLEFSINCTLPYIPHEKQPAYRSRTEFHSYQGK